MRLEYQILLALALDFALGDPRPFPHPVKGIGWLALVLEGPARRVLRSAFAAGLLTALTVLAAAGLVAWGLIGGARMIQPWLGDGISVLILYTCFAARDLSDHSRAVDRALGEGDLPLARKRVGMIVGRDTDGLDEAGIVRATVESVAENTADGVIAALFYAVLGGPVAALVYKAVNTLDSTFGYRNVRYLMFGRASARLDDVANYLPARFTVLLIALATFLTGGKARRVLRLSKQEGSGITPAPIPDLQRRHLPEPSGSG